MPTTEDRIIVNVGAASVVAQQHHSDPARLSVFIEKANGYAMPYVCPMRSRPSPTIWR